MTLASAPHVLVARLDNAGDVLLAGPAIRAVAATSRRVTVLCGSAGKAAAELLPGVDEIVVFDAPWVSFDAPPVVREPVDELVERVAGLEVDRAFILTSFHQSPLPLALLLRLAGVPELAAVSIDFPGSLLDVRHHVDDDVHEVERALSLVATLGHRLPRGDGGALRLRSDLPERRPFTDPYVVVHPGASVPARSWSPERARQLVDVLAGIGWSVAVTGAPDEAELTAHVAGAPRPNVADLGGRTDLAALAGVLRRAAAVVCGNTGPAHLAAAVGTPVVSIFAPVVPARVWRPWGVPISVLGDQEIECAGCRARTCPRLGQPCLADVTPALVAQAVEALTVGRASAPKSELVA